MPFMPNDHLTGQFYWPADHYSVPADNLCWHAPDDENSDCLCVLPTGHVGNHKYEWSPLIRTRSHKRPV